MTPWRSNSHLTRALAAVSEPHCTNRLLFSFVEDTCMFLPSSAFFRVKRVKCFRRDGVVPTDSLLTLYRRARIRQLEAEALGLKTAVAAVEARAASDLSSEQASSIRKMAEAETRHQVSNTGWFTPITQTIFIGKSPCRFFN